MLWEESQITWIRQSQGDNEIFNLSCFFYCPLNLMFHERSKTDIIKYMKELCQLCTETLNLF